MVKLTRVLFGVADVVIGIFLLSCIWILVKLYFAVLDVTFPGGSNEFEPIFNAVLSIHGLPSLMTVTLVLVAIVTVFVVGYVFSFLLLLQKQVLGLFIMLVLDLLGFLLWPIDLAILLGTAVRWLILGSPWLLTWMDLKKRGELGH